MGVHSKLSSVRLSAVAMAALLAAARIVSTSPALAAQTSTASLAVPASPEGSSSLDWAEAHTLGCWYSYGGSSCSPGYDCSGLVSTAVKDATGIWLGRTTYDMLRSPHLVRSYHPERGDLVFFYGGSHVEFLTSLPYTTYGAHDSGSRVGYLHWGHWPAGTVFYWIR